METAKLMQAAGLVVFVVGAILLALGTTSTMLFVCYGAVTLGGTALAAAGRKRQDQR